MTDFSHSIANWDQYDFHVSNPDEKNINKVILFTDKDKVSNVMKALSAEFRFKLRFFVVHAIEDSPNQDFEEEILQKYNITDRDTLPELFIE